MNVALPLDENRPGISGNENLKKTSCLPCHRKALELISITYADNFHVPDMNQINYVFFTNPVICSFFTEYAKSHGEIIPANLTNSRTVNLIGRSYQEQVGSRLDDSTQKFIPVTIL
jgi:hypothetical protein